MILVDTSVWIDHLHSSEPGLVKLLGNTEVVQHPMVIGELALGSLAKRTPVLDALSQLPEVTVASHAEVMHLVEKGRLYGQGLSLVDAHLLASVILTPGALLWTRDKRLRTASDARGVLYRPTK